MKKIILISFSLLIILTAFRKYDLYTSPLPDQIDLESKLTQPVTVVVESGCTPTYYSAVEIKNPINTMPSSPTARFTLAFSAEQKNLVFSVVEINNELSQDLSSTQEFKIRSGQSLRLKLKFQLNNKDFDFNKAVLIEGKIKPKMHKTQGGFVASFIDLNKTNDFLSQIMVIGSPNTICNKCLVTETLVEHLSYLFFTTGIDYGQGDCQKFPAFLSANSTQAVLNRLVFPLDNAKAEFQFIKNGVITNTTIKKVLIKNKEGKFLTFSANIPRFMDRLINDLNHYQDWVILRSNSNNCGDKSYKLVQYLNGSTCKELTQSIGPDSKFILQYRDGISNDNGSGKVLIKPKYEVINGTNTN